MSTNRVDPTAAPLDMNIVSTVTVPRQTPNDTFGSKVQVGTGQVLNGTANIIGAAGGVVPGASVISTAVSSVGSTVGGSTMGTTAYASNGVVPVGTTQSTSLGSTSTVTSTGQGPGYLTNSTTPVMDLQQVILESQKQSLQTLALQKQMNDQSQNYMAISNIMKVSHDSKTQSIRNIQA